MINFVADRKAFKAVPQNLRKPKACQHRVQADVLPRSVSRLFSARKTLSVSLAGSRGNTQLTQTVGPLHNLIMMLEQKMIPQNLHWAFEEGHRVYTIAGIGKMKMHRLANLVLPSGKISTGYPSNNFTNESNKVQPQVPPGTYSVSINVVRNTAAAGAFAFVALKFTNTKTVSWEAAGQFFTDSGDGCIFDAEVAKLLYKKRNEMSRQEWGQLKTAALHDGDGNLILDEKTGINAIIFRAGDWSYNCFIGRDSNGQISSFVIDGRIQQLDQNPFKSFLKLFKPRSKA